MNLTTTKSIVYKITNTINSKCYIGITDKTFRRRYNCRDDWWNAPSVSPVLRNAVKKYGSEETRLKSSKKLKGKSAWNKGKKYTKEICTKMSLARKGKKTWNKGLKTGTPSEQAILNSAKAHCKSVKCFSKDGTLIKIYKSLIETKLDGFNPCQVSLCCKGKAKTHREHLFAYYANQ